MRKILLILLTCALIPLPVLGDSSVSVIVDGKNIGENTFLEGGTTYAPLRAICESLGQTVFWDNDTRTVYIGEETKNAALGEHVNIVINGIPFLGTDVNGKNVYPVIRHDLTYLPVRAIGEAFGKSVVWDSVAHRVFISTPTSAEVFESVSSALAVCAKRAVSVDVLLKADTTETLWTENISLKFEDVFPALHADNTFAVTEDEKRLGILGEITSLDNLNDALPVETVADSEIFSLKYGFCVGELILNDMGETEYFWFEIPLTLSNSQINASYTLRVIGTLEAPAPETPTDDGTV
ncbi:MAG: copper amine oxidase N-terminal domain-containing protein [Clostridia bacterium]|nr:copper amine oxidase N-terminal domain-containing protein [Clostridia bacterium]